MFALDDCSRAVLDCLRGSRPPIAEAVTATLSPRFDQGECARRWRSCAGSGRSARRSRCWPGPKILPLKPVPLQTLVVNVTNQCNLACTYCYEYGEDKIVDTENGKQPKFMTEDTARESVEFLLRESRDNPTRAHDVLRRRNAAELPGASSPPSPTHGSARRSWASRSTSA